jgi:hypothetical protein
VEQARKALAEQRERGDAGAEDGVMVQRWLDEHAP